MMIIIMIIMIIIMNIIMMIRWVQPTTETFPASWTHSMALTSDIERVVKTGTVIEDF